MRKNDLLDIGREKSIFESKFIFEDTSNAKNYEEKKKTQMKIIPAPLFCLKSKLKDGSKIFINFCTSKNIPEPITIDENEISKLMLVNDSRSHIPVCVGLPHMERDNDGFECCAYEFIVNPVFKMFSTEVGKGDKAMPSLSFWTLLIENLIFETLKENCHIDIDYDFGFKRLKNRIVFGSPLTTFLNQTPKKLIEEINDEKKLNEPLFLKQSIAIEDPFSGIKWKFISSQDSNSVLHIIFTKQIDFEKMELFCDEQTVKLKNTFGRLSQFYLNLPFKIIPEETKSKYLKDFSSLKIFLKKT